jgi:Ca-activated chloride channel family protein
VKKLLVAILFLATADCRAAADGGVLIPRDKAQPDPAVLSLEEMEITVQIDNGDARVFVRQIFANHTERIEEGNYVFALPALATVSDFAVWDGPVRIPAVILERRRALEIYDQLKRQAVDPGLLQMGEQGSDEARRSAIFSARIVPIPAYGTKRLEFEYHQSIPAENFKSYFAIPLRPDAYHAQSARQLRINFELHSAHAIGDFQATAKSYGLEIDEQSAHTVKAHFAGREVNLTEDFVTTFTLQPASSDALQVITHREPNRGQPSPTEIAALRNNQQPGFFAAGALLGAGTAQEPASKSAKDLRQQSPKTLIILLDTSLSMQWEKLERSYQALETLLRTLQPEDRFNLILFNSEIERFAPLPVSADSAAIQRALEQVRGSRLRGGTDLQKALGAGLLDCSSASSVASNPYLVLLSDGGATQGTIQNGKLAAWYEAQRKLLAPEKRPRTYIFGVGDDANLPLLKMLAREEGVLETVLSTEPLDYKLPTFLSKIGRSPVGGLQLHISPAAAVDSVYPLEDASFSGALASWVGRYSVPRRATEFTVSGSRDGTPFTISRKADLPSDSPEHPQLPRLWARARVDALLEKIERDGEDQAAIDEIIRLARLYKFVTPYTSFLAAPRALLRPRVIRPGDPILRVATRESMTSVVALFPFGLVQRLRHLPDEDVWQTRFFAPADMQDGIYGVRLVMRDRAGHTFRETKTLVISSKTPVVQIKMEQKRVRRGESLPLKVAASRSTRTLLAHLDGAPPVALRWDSKAGLNTGQLFVPEQMIPGTYRLTVTAEDLAHNMGSQEVDIEVVP